MQDFVWCYSLLNWLLLLLQNVLMKFCERIAENSLFLSMWVWICFHSWSIISKAAKKSEPKETHCFWFSRCHRLTGVGRDLWVSPGPIPCSGRATYSRLPEIMPGWLCTISRNGDFTTSASAQSLSQWKNNVQYQGGTSCVSDRVHWLWSGKEAWLHSLYNISGIYIHS